MIFIIKGFRTMMKTIVQKPLMIKDIYGLNNPLVATSEKYLQVYLNLKQFTFLS